jgi:hypothetical protein
MVGSGGDRLGQRRGPPFLAGFSEEDSWALAFIGLAAMNVYVLSVLLTAYRRGERWASRVTWVPVAIYALVTFYADEGAYYLGTAAVMAIAQLLTWSGFRDLAQ